MHPDLTYLSRRVSSTLELMGSAYQLILRHLMEPCACKREVDGQGFARYISSRRTETPFLMKNVPATSFLIAPYFVLFVCYTDKGNS
jgi:hypothetical protein